MSPFQLLNQLCDKLQNSSIEKGLIYAKKNRFLLINELPTGLVLNIEPEGVIYMLGTGEEVLIHDQFSKSPVTLKVSTSNKADIILSIWPGDGTVRVEKDGVDILDLK
jgi:hypothetical protein